EVSRRLIALTGPAKLGMCDLSNVALEVVSLVRQQLQSWAELSIEVPDPVCVIPIGRDTAMQLLSSLLRNALANVERAGRRGNIVVRLNIEDDLVILEVSDDGAPVDNEVRRQALESPAIATRIGPHGLSLVIAARQIRNGGGEILIDSQSELG